jgi:hypothetical protein
MPGTTATQKLTYPTSGDNLKEQAQYLETLAKQLDARVAANADLLARQLDRPCAIIDCTVPNVISNQLSSSLIQFDSVVLDTAGLIDLSSDRRVITLNSTGYWLVGGYVDFQGTPGGSGCSSLGAIALALNCDNGVAARWPNFVKDLNSGHSYLHTSGLTQILSPSAPGRLYMNAALSGGTGCGTTFNVFTARMWAFKVREL